MNKKLRKLYKKDCIEVKAASGAPCCAAAVAAVAAVGAAENSGLIGKNTSYAICAAIGLFWASAMYIGGIFCIGKIFNSCDHDGRKDGE